MMECTVLENNERYHSYSSRTTAICQELIFLFIKE